MRKIKVLQQVLDPSGAGGVSAEYRALCNSNLSDEFEFEPMILNEYHSGINKADIDFYYKKIVEYQPDIIHIRGAAVDGLNAEIAAKKYGRAKILVCIHGMYSDMVYLNPFKRFVAKYYIEPKCFKLADGISCVYKKGSEVKQLKRYKKKVVQYVYNRMPDFSNYNRDYERECARAELSIANDDIVAVYCGGISKEKGMIYFGKVLKEMATEWNENFHIIMCGDGDYKFKLENLCRELGISKHIHFVGCVKNVPHYLLASDFFVMPSLHENHSIAILEALSAGLPCVVTDVGGNSESVKDGVTGLVVKTFDIGKFKEAIIKMLGEERIFYANNIVISDFDIFKNDSVDNQLRKAYKEVLG